MESDSEFIDLQSNVHKSRRVISLLEEDDDIGLVLRPEHRLKVHPIVPLLKKNKRKRCDTWHGEEKKEVILDPGIEQGLNTKRKFARKNAWGYCSYADLITMALERAPSKQMTLAEIYDWIVANIPFFKDKGDHNSSVGWKNSIRHNLSLHDKFCRVTPTNTTKNIGAYWTLVPENDKEDLGINSGRSPSSEMDLQHSMSPPSCTSVPSPPSNFRKRSSTMPTNLNRPQRPSKCSKRNSSTSFFDAKSIGGDSGIDRLSRHSSCASLAANNVTEDMARINLDTSPLSMRNVQTNNNENDNGRIIEENMEKINRFNRDAKINPDNSVLVEVSLTAEQFELVKSGKYIVSLCDPNADGGQTADPRLTLTNWKASTQNVKSQNRPEYKPPPSYDTVKYEQQQPPIAPAKAIPIQRRSNSQLPFSPLSSESSGIGYSYSPPDINVITERKNDYKESCVITPTYPRQVKSETSMFTESITTGSMFEIDLAEFNLYEMNEFCEYPL